MTLTRVGAATLTLLVVVLPTAAGQQAPVYRSGVDLTRIKVAVVDSAGVPLRGLEARAFRVLENGVEQPLQVMLDPENAPLDVALVLDFSASVVAEWPDPQPREAIHRLLDALAPSDCVLLNPFHFVTGPGVWGAPADVALRSLVDTFHYAGETRLYDAVTVAQRALGARRRPAAEVAAPEAQRAGAGEAGACGEALNASTAAGRRSAIVVLTDGEDTTSRVEYSQVLLDGFHSEVPVFAVAVGMAAARPPRSQYRSFADYRREVSYLSGLQEQLGELARVSGGHLVTQRQIADGYSEVMALLRGYYVLAYRTPANARLGWSDIEVQVDGAGEVLVQPGVFRMSPEAESARSALLAGEAALANDDLDSALSLFRTATVIDPLLGAAHLGQGVVYQQRRQFTQARDAFVRALERLPGTASIHARLADAQIRLGEYDDAWNHTLRAHRAGVNMSRAIDTLRRVSVEPSDFDVRARGALLHLAEPSVPDLAAQIALAEIVRQVRTGFESFPEIVLGTEYAEFVGWFEVRKLDHESGETDVRLVFLDTLTGDDREERIRVDDLADVIAVVSAVEHAVGKGREWVARQQRGRQ